MSRLTGKIVRNPDGFFETVNTEYEKNSNAQSNGQDNSQETKGREESAPQSRQSKRRNSPSLATSPPSRSQMDEINNTRKLSDISDRPSYSRDRRTDRPERNASELSSESFSVDRTRPDRLEERRSERRSERTVDSDRKVERRSERADDSEKRRERRSERRTDKSNESERRDRTRQERKVEREEQEKRLASGEPSPRTSRPTSRQRRRSLPKNEVATDRERVPKATSQPAKPSNFDAMLNDLDDMFATATVEQSPASPVPEAAKDSPMEADRPKRRKPTFGRKKKKSSEDMMATSKKITPIPEAEMKKTESPVVSPLPEPPTPMDEDDDNVPELERLEMEKQRKELERLNQEKKAASRREAEMVAAEREKRTAQEREKRFRDPGDFALLNRRPANESLLVDDYVKALVTVLRSDRTISPLPDDFSTPEGFSGWRQTIRIPLQDMLAKMLKYRYLERQDDRRQDPKLFFKIVSCRALVSKDGRTRDCYCNILCGDIAQLKKERKREVFQTETIKGTLEPTWNQHLNLELKSSSDQILVEVWDRLKDHFLGRVILDMAELVRKCSRKDFISNWYELTPRESKYRDKYVGGEILIEACLDQDSKQRGGNSFEQIQQKMNSFGIDNRSLFRTLMRACIVLDLGIPRDGRTDVLTEESIAMLKIWAKYWGIVDSSQLILYLEIMFQKFRGESVPADEVLKAFHVLHAAMRNKNMFSSRETKRLLELLEEMRDHLKTQVTRYKECFPKNRPPNALDSCILLLRMIHRLTLFKQAHPELPDSFRDDLRSFLGEACIAKFQRFKELHTPFDETDVEAVLGGITKLAEMVSEEIEQDAKYYQPAFAQELDIVRLTASYHLKYFILTLEDCDELISSDEAVQNASKTVFEFYKRVRFMNDRYAKLVPGLTSNTSGSGFDIERWFSAFIYKWLKDLQAKSKIWVDSAIKVDNFDPPDDDEELVNSSSITDVFSAIYTALEMITDLEWSNSVQNAYFFLMFSKTVNAAMENYCDAISEQDQASKTLLASATNLLAGSKQAPQDIESESCVKLRNVSFAMRKLKEMYRTMNVDAIQKAVKDHRKSLRPKMTDELSGLFKVYISYGENIKPINKNGLSNPYVIVRVPEGTVVPAEENLEPQLKDDGKALPPSAPIVLNGSACDLVKSRSITDNVNPVWNETHEISLPPVSRLEVAVFSKNLITADEVAGTAIIDLANGTRLRRKLMDYQTHDLFVELEPQGRILLRLTMEGEKEDVDFWFRRSNERLIRTRDDFLKSLTTKMIPYTKEVLTKAVKDNEAVPLPAKSFLSSFTSTVQYSDETSQGIKIDKQFTMREVDDCLEPLLAYLERNLSTLCGQLPSNMATEVIQRTWDEIIVVIENILLPPLYGTIDPARRILNKRQVSLIQRTLDILLEFFHEGGEDLIIPMDQLKSRTYLGVEESAKMYDLPVAKLMREYELSFREGIDKEYLIRLIRMHASKSKDEKQNEWIETTLGKRKELVSR